MRLEQRKPSSHTPWTTRYPLILLTQVDTHTHTRPFTPTHTHLTHTERDVCACAGTHMCLSLLYVLPILPNDQTHRHTHTQTHSNFNHYKDYWLIFLEFHQSFPRFNLKTEAKWCCWNISSWYTKKIFADLKKSSTLTSFQKLRFHAITLSVNRKRPTCVLK